MTARQFIICALWSICAVFKINEGCIAPLGMKDNTIPDSAITASSALLDPFDYYSGHRGRLDGGPFWQPDVNEGSWVQVDFGYPEVKLMNGIITQGTVWWNRWVITLQVQYGNSTDALIPILEGGSPKTFAGNIDPFQHNTIVFPETIAASIIRIVPMTWQESVGLRWEILGCDPDFVPASPSACANSPCLNNGQCRDFSHPTAHACVCTDEFVGDNCETGSDITSCTHMPCVNNATCKDFGSKTLYFCDCLDGYSGLNCQVIDTVYTPHPCKSGAFKCQNGGKCSGLADNPYCIDCSFPYGGKTCAKWQGKYIAMVVILVLLACKVLFWICCCCCKSSDDSDETTGNDVKMEEAKTTQEPLVEEKV